MAAHRNLQDQRSIKPESASFSLEQGMSALIAKFLVLGFDDLALEELRILRRRVESIRASKDADNPRQTSVNSQPYWEDESPDSRVETLPELLKFKACNATGPLLAIIVSTQLQVLRLLKSKANASRIQEALEHLRLDVPYSPVNLIHRQIDPNLVKSKERAANQLESFSQTLLSISSDHSSGLGDVNDTKSALSPQVVFQLQTLALEVRRKWWSLVEHRSDTLKELIEPFARCLEAFRQRSSLGNKQRYQMAVAAFNTVTFGLGSPTRHLIQGFSNIYYNLAELAQECMQYDDATCWLEKAISNLENDGSQQAKRCALICREVALQIRSDPSYDKEPTLLFQLERALTCLEGGLHGTSDDLDEVLIAVTSLRKSAFNVIQDIYKTKATETSRPPADLVGACVRVNVRAVRFMNRYIGTQPDKSAHPRTLLRYNERRQLAYPFAKSSIESVVAVTKTLTKISSIDLNSIDCGLRECVSLASSLEDMATHHASSSTPAPTVHSAFVSISNGYWYRFLQMKQALGDTKAVKSGLSISIELLKRRGLCDRIAGALPSKLEAYAQLCEKLREDGTALATYREALRIQTDSGLVQKAAEFASTGSLSVVLDGENDLRGLARNMNRFIRVAQRLQDPQKEMLLYYDDHSLPTHERGLLLECQLHCLTLVLQERGGSSQLGNAMCGLTDAILSLYSAHETPIRRLRTVIQMLYIRAMFPDAIKEAPFFALLDEYGQQRSTLNCGSDVGLKVFMPHLVSSLEIFLAMREEKPDTGIFVRTFQSWAGLIADCSDWAALQEHVYDIHEWLLHLELIVQYLALEGLEVLKTSALHIIATVHEISKSGDCSDLVSKFCSLGVHYVRLGYCGAGGVMLQKAHLYLETYKPSARLTLRWYLSYAEYALGSQNYNLW